MIDLYFWPTPNGYKPLICLEEMGLEYALKPINIGTGEQFAPAFLKIAPNNRIPALVDGAQSVFESGAILMYLAEKTGKFLPKSGAARVTVMEWVMWQMGGLGPMMGQANHFILFAKEDVPYGKTRYRDETKRLLGVLNTQLAGKDYIAGAYSIADMMNYPWVRNIHRLEIDEADYPNVQEWMHRMAARDAVVRAYAAA